MRTTNADDTDEDFQSSEIPYLTLGDRVREWWAKATGPVYRVEHASLTEAVRERILMWIPVVLPLVVASLAMGVYIFSGWRAENLASKAVASAEAGNFRLAAIQLQSARQLRSKHPALVKAQALVSSMAGDPASVDLWAKASVDDMQLSQGEMATRAESLIKFGNSAQRERALADLDAAGLPVEASVARARLAFQSGGLQSAVDHAREAVSIDPSPENKLLLARALIARHRPFLRNAKENRSRETESAVAEVVGLVDSLTDTPHENEALALGLVASAADPATHGKWANKAWRTPTATNPALLPAATWLIRSGEMERGDIIAKLRFIFAGQQLPQRALLAEWLITQSEAQTALDTITARDATRHPVAFIAYTKALARKGNWAELLGSAEGGANIPEPLRLVAVAFAAKELKKSGQAEKAVVDALKTAATSSLLDPTLRAMDGLGMNDLVDETLTGMCADSSAADTAFAAARERFERNGNRKQLERAFGRAKTTAPAAPSVTNYARYLDLLAGGSIDPATTAAAITMDAKNASFRITHALALLQAGKPAEAFAVFDDFTLFFHALGPSAKAVITAVWGAKGDTNGARELARAIDLSKISEAEKALISAYVSSP